MRRKGEKGIAANDEREPKTELVARRGCGFMFYLIGIVVAVIRSWTLHHSIFHAVVQGSLSWIYILYRLLFS